ncbi:MAG TPA: FAD-dependent monooxygenase, partial [Gammaproteobacteria bacterium]|nr:FAD-dependent monooxygenase [Gammaproteobacteria bacterium]
TLILPLKGKNSFEALKDEQQLEAFFEENFDDLRPIISGLVKEFFEQPLANLTTITVNQQHYNDEILLLGDAAHTMLPFLGQGTNCGFEDCRLYNKMLDEGESFSTFVSVRKKETDAIIEMSSTEYRELLPHYSAEREMLMLNVEKHRHLILFSHMPYSTIQQIKDVKNTGNLV